MSVSKVWDDFTLFGEAAEFVFLDFARLRLFPSYFYVSGKNNKLAKKIEKAFH